MSDSLQTALQAKRRERQESEAALGMAPAAADATLARSTLAPLVPLDAAPLLDENGRPIQQPRLVRVSFAPSAAAAAAVTVVAPACHAPALDLRVCMWCADGCSDEPF